MLYRSNSQLISYVKCFIIVMILLCPGCGKKSQKVIDKQEFSDAIKVCQAGDSTELYFLEKKIDDDDVAKLAELGELHKLCLAFTEVSNASMETIAKIPGLVDLDLAGVRIDDNGLKSLANHPTLKRVVLNETPITNAGLKTIATIPNLECLELYRCHITDEDCKQIGKMKNLVKISLDSTSITDKGLQFLYPLAKLKRLQIWDTGVTDEGREILEKEMPNVSHN